MRPCERGYHEGDGVARMSALRASPTGLVAACLYLVFTAMSLIQDVGRTTYDTRVELTERPAAFLAETFRLWHPEANFGEIQNQAYGYLFPQGPFFLMADQLGLADWVTQRLWSALLVIVACEGARRVARALGLDPGPALVAGVVFGMSPRLLGTVSVISAESLPGAVMPWVLLPVLLTLRGRLSPFRGAVLSGAAVVCMGGVNAVENIAVLPLPALFVAWGVLRGLAPRRFLAQWLSAVGVASLWWLVPLVVVGPFSPPFYEYVESARNTTGIVGFSEAVRGSSHWVAYLLVGDRPWWPAAYQLVTDPLLVIVSAAIAAVGLAGVMRLRSDVRTPLLLSVLVGMSALTLAHGGPAGSPISEAVVQALDGSLQIFRNVHKVDPIVRLPLAIGFAHAVVLLADQLVRSRPGLASHRAVLLAVPACLALVLGQPYLSNEARTPGWTDLPGAWQETQAYLAEHADDSYTLVVPGSAFALQDWGWTLEEPLLALDADGRVARTQVPLVPGQSIRFLSGLDRLVSGGRATEALGEQLARAGIGHVVVRRDLEESLTGSANPGGAAVSLQAAGLASVAGFGRSPEGDAAVEVYEVREPAPLARTVPIGDVLTVSGAPESILALQDEGLTGPDGATVLAGEDGWDAPVDIVTDTLQRRERAFGSINEALSSVLGADEAYRVPRAAHDFPAAPGGTPVVASYDGLTSLTASSSRGYADTYGPVLPQEGPYSAVDADPATRWVSSPASRPEQQWLRLDFDDVREVDRVTVRPVVGDPSLAPIAQVEVRAGDERRLLTMNPTGATVTASFDGVQARSVEVRVREVVGGVDRGSVALTEVAVDGVTPTRSLVVPGSLTAQSALLLQADPGARACTATLEAPRCDVLRIRASEEPQGMSRVVEAAEDTELALSGSVVARGTRSAALLLEPILAPAQVGATSIYGSDPRVSSRFLSDGNRTTAWLSDPRDTLPTVLLRWPRARVVSGIRIRTVGGVAHAPAQVIVRVGSQQREYAVPGDSLLRIPPVRTDQLELAFPTGGAGDYVRISELRVLGQPMRVPFDPATPFTIRCGFGPNLFVDGHRILTRVRGTMGDIVTGTPVSFRSCGTGGGQPEVPLVTGSHEITTEPSGEFEVVRLVGRPTTGPLASSAATTGRPVETVTWGSASRSVDVAAGPEAVLAVAENFNPAWRATVDGRVLEPVRVDGWQQGWIVPEGSSESHVVMRFVVQPVYTAGLLASLGISGLLAFAGVGLLLLQAVGRRRRAFDPPLLGEGIDELALWPPSPGWRRAGASGLCVLVVLLLGAVSAVSMAVVAVARGARSWVVAAAAAAMVLVSGIVDVLAWQDWHRDAADLLAATAVGLLAGALVRPEVGTAGGAHLLTRLAQPWRGRQGVAALVVLVGGLVWRAVLLWDSYYNQDDYYLSARGLDADLTWDFLLTPVAGHVMPAQQLVYWAVARLAPFNWPFVAMLLVVGQLVAGLLAWHLLCRLLPGRWSRLPLFVVLVVSPLTLATTLWWSAYMGLWPHVIAALLAVTFLVRDLQGRGSRAANVVGVLAATCFGLAWHERSILIPVLLVGVALALGEGRGWARVRSAALRHRALWLVLVIGGAGYLLVHSLLTSVEAQDASARDRLAITWAFLAENVAPGLVSGPWAAELKGGAVAPYTWVTVVSLCLVVVVAGLLVRVGGPGRFWALAMLGAYLTLGLAMLLLGRAGFGYVIGLDPRYTSDAVLVAVLSVALALAGEPGRAAGPRPGRRRLTALGAVAISVAYVAGAAVTTAVLVPHFQNTDDREYLETLHTALARDREQVVYDDLVPPQILLPLLGDEARLSQVLAPDPQRPLFDAATTKLRVVSEDGSLDPVDLEVWLGMQPGPDGPCQYAVRNRAVTRVPLVRTWTGRSVLQVGYFTDTETDVEVRIEDWVGQFHADAGPNVVYLFPPGDIPLREFRFQRIGGSPGTLCVADLRIGDPMAKRPEK
jgi:arabinofuranan 3-O-arabinosyltransferase